MFWSSMERSMLLDWRCRVEPMDKYRNESLYFFVILKTKVFFFLFLIVFETTVSFFYSWDTSWGVLFVKLIINNKYDNLRFGNTTIESVARPLTSCWTRTRAFAFDFIRKNRAILIIMLESFRTFIWAYRTLRIITSDFRFSFPVYRVDTGKTFCGVSMIHISTRCFWSKKKILTEKIIEIYVCLSFYHPNLQAWFLNYFLSSRGTSKHLYRT